MKCGDIFCSAHCSKEVPLDQALDFNPSEGVMSRACVGCYEAYEQWQGVIPSPEYDQAYLHSAFRESHDTTHPGATAAATVAATAESSPSRSTSSLSASTTNSKKNTGQLPDGYLGDDQSRAETSNIAIKRRPSKDQTIMPMPSVPHDWSWSTF
ncbi:hypothetical protein BGW39_010424 [Mortierella sp. 14UC]|nr:hypothetical protein BGW39_010424 [Mortierella sp. 14UC]